MIHMDKNKYSQPGKIIVCLRWYLSEAEEGGAKSF